MAHYNLIGRQQRHDIHDFVPLLAEKLHVNVLLLQFKCVYKIFVSFFY